MAGHIVIFIGLRENCDTFHVSGRLGRWHTYQAAKAEAMERKAEGFYIFWGLGRLPTEAEREAAEPFYIGGSR